MNRKFFEARLTRSAEFRLRDRGDRAAMVGEIGEFVERRTRIRRDGHGAEISARVPGDQRLKAIVEMDQHIVARPDPALRHAGRQPRHAIVESRSSAFSPRPSNGSQIRKGWSLRVRARMRTSSATSSPLKGWSGPILGLVWSAFMSSARHRRVDHHGGAADHAALVADQEGHEIGDLAALDVAAEAACAAEMAGAPPPDRWAPCRAPVPGSCRRRPDRDGWC